MNKPTILIIDDDTTILSVVEATLEQGGYSPIVTTNPIEGLEIISSINPTAIILDLKMPEMDGDDVLKKLKGNDKTKDIPVIMLTSKHDIMDVSYCLELGAADYIVKPFDHKNLIIRIQKIIDKAARVA